MSNDDSYQRWSGIVRNYEQRFKTLTNLLKESDERLTLFEKDVRALRTAINELQRIIIKTESETTTKDNERQ